MPADIDVIVGGSSPISFTPRYSFNSEVHRYDASPSLNSDGSKVPFVSRNNPLDFPTALSSSPNSSAFLAHSPSIFGTSPPTHFTFHGRCSSPTLRPISSSPIKLTRSFSHLRLNSSESEPMPVAVPRRPCLVVRCDVLDLPSPNKHKKRVVFADDRGFPLTLVRTMTEPSNMPPQFSLQFLAKVTQHSFVDKISELWEVMFSQPASDYLDFRRRLETSNVSLENVIIKESEKMVFGTVKVRNLTYHKEVFLRTTYDGWKTYEDLYCTYVPSSPPANGVTILYDTFSFRLPFPAKSRKIEFCVCFRCSGKEYWDNHSGENYIIAKKDDITQNKRSTTSEFKGSSAKQSNFRKTLKDDMVGIENESWSEFSSWNQLSSQTPYW